MEKERLAEHEDPDKLYAQELEEDEEGKVKKPKGKSKGRGKGKGKGAKGRGRGSQGRGRGKAASTDQETPVDSSAASEPSAASGVGSGDGVGEKPAQSEEVILGDDDSKVESPQKRKPGSPKGTATISKKRAVLLRAKSQSPGKRVKLDHPEDPAHTRDEAGGDSKVPEWHYAK